MERIVLEFKSELSKKRYIEHSPIAYWLPIPLVSLSIFLLLQLGTSSAFAADKNIKVEDINKLRKAVKSPECFSNPEYVLFIVDCSTSMGERLDYSKNNEETKQDLAEKIISKTIDTFPASTRYGLRVFGSNDVKTASGLLVPFKENSKYEILKKVHKIKPYGEGDLTEALKQVSLNDFRDTNRNTMIILLTDKIVDQSQRISLQKMSLCPSAIVWLGKTGKKYNVKSNQLFYLANYTGGRFYIRDTITWYYNDLKYSGEPYAPFSFRGIKRAYFIFDCSKSMNEKIKVVNGRKLSKFEEGKTVFQKILKELPPDTQVALRVFGSEAPSGVTACRDTKLIESFKKLNRKQFIRAVERMNPQGLSPLEFTLYKAIDQDLKDARKNTVIFLIGDGVDCCGGHPEAYVRSRQKICVPIIVIGLDIRRNNAKKKLVEIAKLSQGRYYSDKDIKALEKDLKTFHEN